MKTMEPRAATGMLDELTPVAPFTTPFGKIDGVDWANNEEANQKTHVIHFDIRTLHSGRA
jgi:hypothetical protein